MAVPPSFGDARDSCHGGPRIFDFIYKTFTTSDIEAAIGGVRGCSVSMPIKEVVIPLVDAIEPSASAIESVTIVNDEGRLTAVTPTREHMARATAFSRES